MKREMLLRETLEFNKVYNKDFEKTNGSALIKL